MENNTVIVIDLGQYKSSYAEKVPFKAIVTITYQNECWVKSLATDKNYEVYYDQILENLDIDKISEILDLTKY